MAEATPTYQLGKTKFTVTHDDPDFLPVIARLLLRPPGQNSTAEVPTLDLRLGLSFDIAECLRQVIARHEGCLLIQSACLITPERKNILITGAPGSGKTTLALALAFRQHWKIIAEDMTIIDEQESSIVAFSAPFNLKTGTRELLNGIGVSVPPFVLKEWLPLGEHAAELDVESKFDFAFHLAGEPSHTSLSCMKLTVSEFTRNILPISNLLSVRGTEKFSSCLPANQCNSFAGGTLEERWRKIVEICLQ